MWVFRQVHFLKTICTFHKHLAIRYLLLLSQKLLRPKSEEAKFLKPRRTLAALDSIFQAKTKLRASLASQVLEQFILSLLLLLICMFDLKGT